MNVSPPPAGRARYRHACDRLTVGGGRHRHFADRR
jgi:hypothetical protein